MFLSISPHPPFFHFKTLDQPTFSKPQVFPTRPSAAVSRSVDSHSYSHQTTSNSVIKRISDKLRQLGYVDVDSSNGVIDSVTGSAGEIFIPTPKEVPKYNVGSTLDSSWSLPQTPINNTSRLNQQLFKEKEIKSITPKEKDSVSYAAELKLPKKELKRLISLGIKISTRLKIGKAGITEGILNGIHERFRRSEIVKIQCEDLCRLNMKRTHETLELKTGGMVIWRAGSIIILYRGSNYKYPYFHQTDENNPSNGSENNPLTRPVLIQEESKLAEETDAYFHQTDDSNSSNGSENNTPTRPVSIPSKNTVRLQLPEELKPAKQTDVLLKGSETRPVLIPGFGSKTTVRLPLPGEVKLAKQTDLLLNGLGKRVEDWWGPDPKPVDGDSLPGVIAGFRNPFRVLPEGVKLRLTDSEMTVLRRLSRHLPCHFALGRNNSLHGLAEAMIKLWEKCEIAKIAVKRGVQNIDSEIISEELKKLAGGTLVSRDREFIVFYRGKDFLPPAVSNSIYERQKYAKNTQEKGDERENTRLKNQEEGDDRENTCLKNQEEADERENACLRNQEEVDERENTCLKIQEKGDERENTCLENQEKGDERESTHLKHKEEKDERENTCLKNPKGDERENTCLEFRDDYESEISDGDLALNKETISEEERYMLRRVGLRMKPFLLLGRRGVFDGTIENMHLHWKYRELVKIVTREKNTKEVENKASILEIQSGGILVSIEKITKGHVIIIYRGKNYKRPKTLRPKSLLNKKEALKMSLEAQRSESLKLHVLNLEAKQEMNKNELQINAAQIEETKGPANYERTVFEDTKEYSEPTTESSSLNTSEAQINTTNLQCEVVEKENLVGTQYKAAPLTNKERLILRKQALNMKKKPVLAVAKNNVISGVVKTIKTHFIKHPLAIVNIKNRSEDKSVQQLIFELEEATGSVFVSREPNKVILYRGWLEGEIPNNEQTDANNNTNEGENENNNSNNDVENGESILTELMEAIKVECGFEPRM